MKTFKGVFVALLYLNCTQIFAEATQTNTLKGISIDGLLTSAVTQSDNDTDTAYNNGSSTEKLDFSGRNNLLGLQIKADVSNN